MVSYEKIFACLQEIYGRKLLKVHRTKLCEIFKAFKIVNLPTVQEGLSECDSILITYGDAIMAFQDAFKVFYRYLLISQRTAFL